MTKMSKYQPILHGGASVVEMKEYPANLNNHVNQNEIPPGGISTGGITTGIMVGRINENNMCPNHEYESNGVTQKTKEVYEEVMNCTYCNKHVKPIVKKYTPFFVYIIILMLFLFLSIFTIFLLPLTVLTFKQKRYVCPSCNKNLTSTEKMFTIKKEDKILIFQCSKCAIIVSIKYLVLFVLLIVLIFSFYIIRKSTNFNLDLLGKGPLINTTWTGFLEDCGNKSQFRNKFHSINNFKNKYYGNTVIWRGHFHHITEGFFNNNSLFIKMVPSEYKYDRPDIQIFFSNSLISKIENLEKNDFIEFECTLLEISKNKKPHLCLLWDVKLLEKYTPKQFTVIEYFRPVSIFDIINLYAPNPFFINLDHQSNSGQAVEIVNISGSNMHNAERLSNGDDDDDDIMINMLQHEIHDMGGDMNKRGSVSIESAGRVHIGKGGTADKAKGIHFIKEEEGHPAVSHFEDYDIYYDGHQDVEEEIDDDDDDEDEDETYEEYFGGGQPQIHEYVDESEQKIQTQEQEKKQEQKQEQEQTHEEKREPKEEQEREQKQVQEQIQEHYQKQPQEPIQEQEEIQMQKQTENGEEMKDDSLYDYQFHIEAEEAINNIETEESNNYDSIVKKEKTNGTK